MLDADFSTPSTLLFRELKWISYMTYQNNTPEVCHL